MGFLKSVKWFGKRTVTIAIATIGRGHDHDYITKKVKVIQQIPGLDKPTRIFGDYELLTFMLPGKIVHKYQFGIQDLASGKPINVTERVVVKRDKIILSGDIIREVRRPASQMEIYLILV